MNSESLQTLFGGNPHPTSCNDGLRPVILNVEAQK